MGLGRRSPISCHPSSPVLIMPSVAAPIHILRNHSAQISALSFSDDNERLYSADTAGRVTILSTRSLRPIASWPAHTDSVLTVRELRHTVITHGRDNKLRVWQLPTADAAVGDSATNPALPIPVEISAHDVNALNFCAFSLLRAQDDSTKDLIALPNLVDSNNADIWDLNTFERLHGAIGKPDGATATDYSENNPRGETGILMSLHLFRDPQSLNLLAGYESGNVILWRNTTQGSFTAHGRGWVVHLKWKLHVESVMGMAVSSDNSFALTISADPLIGFYPLGTDGPEARTFAIKQAGNAAIAIRPDDRVCAVGGWDGKIRLYSTKSFKPLGTLAYHREGCFGLAFARRLQSGAGIDESEEDLTLDELVGRAHWLAAGSKDTRVSVWALREIGEMTSAHN
ncbi:WD-40 repeat-containing protein [Auriculariales sp. MPI-PUGE-AT-0066]|nr:WD-40 repeat-containing protein [Auriculariales sp. MPI-PUGE-AT-0066]